MSIIKAIDDWSRRRYRPTTHWWQHQVPYAVVVQGDPLAPPKGFVTGWRRKWSWAVVRVSFPAELTGTNYLPGYSLDQGHTFRTTIRPVGTGCFAFQIGPKDVRYSIFTTNHSLVDVQLRLLAVRLTWTQVVEQVGDEREVTFV